MKQNTLFLLIKQNKTELALKIVDALKNRSFKKQDKVLNYTNEHNENCIMEAAFRGDKIMVHALNSSPIVNLNKQNALGNTALMLSIINEQIEVIKYILNETHLDNLLITNYKNNTILHLALLTKNEHLIKLIFNHFKNYHHYSFLVLEKIMSTKNQDNMTPLELAFHLKLGILSQLSNMVRPLFLVKNQDSKEFLI